MLIALLQWTGVVPFEWLFILSEGIYFVVYGVGAASDGRLSAGGAARAVTVLCAVTVTIAAGPPMWLYRVVFAAVCLGALALSRRSVTVVRETVR
jgi:amino acid efflux transporter